MKIAFFKEKITPEIGAYLAGYGLNDKSVAILDDLYACGLYMDDGNKKALIISLDLLGLDEWFIKKCRKNISTILGIPEAAVMLTCTHTHTGPETRTLASAPQQLHTAYLDKLEKILSAEAEKLLSATFTDCNSYFFSEYCDANRNRRYVAGDNHATFTPHRREVIGSAEKLFADKELGGVAFFSKETSLPVYIIGNYAAHPLAGHSPGLGGLRISSDFPGAFRDYVTRNTGAECMFITGAAGDMVPKEDELGDGAILDMGKKLGKAALGGVLEGKRNPLRFGMPEAKLDYTINTFTVPLRKKYANVQGKIPAPYLGSDTVTLEIQIIAIGEIAFVGVPGEMCAELGQEIKWNSPFRRTFIAYDATAYFSYMGAANNFAAGGYEAFSQRFYSRGGLKLLCCAEEALFEVYGRIYPDRDPDVCEDKTVTILPNW